MTKKRAPARSLRRGKYAYTVVLLRPEYLGDITQEQYGQDIYVALVTAANIGGAIEAAQQEVFAADTLDGLAPVDAEDYKLCVMFEGHQDPMCFGWQAH
jgi:hypothetical protein